MTDSISPSLILDAEYKEQEIDAYRGNPFIEALPLPMAPAEIRKAFTNDIGYNRMRDTELPMQWRLLRVGQLSDVSIPTKRQISLYYQFDSLIRQGYVSRHPASIDHVGIFADLHRADSHNQFIYQAAPRFETHAQLGTGFLGIAGLGKTTTIKRLRQLFGRVIFHPKLNVFQVPIQLVETPAKGYSITTLGLLNSSILDGLVPNARYVEAFSKSNMSEERLSVHIARQFHNHAVGLFIPDEVQRLLKMPKNKQDLMNTYVAISNTIGTPLAMTGTNDAGDLIHRSFAGARRSSGIAPWFTMERNKDGGEWDTFIETLWGYDFTLKTPPLTESRKDVLYAATAGDTDLDVKLFQAVQKRAILDESESISDKHIRAVVDAELAPCKKFVRAIHRGQLKHLSGLHDEMMDDLRDGTEDSVLKVISQGLESASTTPQDDGWESLVYDTVRVCLQGIPSKELTALVQRIGREHPNSNVLQGVKFVLNTFHVKRPPRTLSDSDGLYQLPPNIEVDPGDYRLAIIGAQNDTTTISEQLYRMGAIIDTSAGLQLTA